MASTDNQAGNSHQPESEPGNDHLITKHQLAARLGGDVTPDTVIRCWRRWGLHPVKIGRELRFTEPDVRAYIDRQQLGDD
jgi:hypothetical protein